MSGDALLIWMSALREGSWQQFRTAVEELHFGSEENPDDADDDGQRRSSLPLYQTLRLNLQRLGHAEFFNGAGGSEWRVTPPCLAITKEGQGWKAILVGARSPNLLRRMQDAGASLSLRCVPAPASPSQYICFANCETNLSSMAKAVGLATQYDAPTALLACLPTINDPIALRQSPLPLGAGWQVERFSVSSLKWKNSSPSEAAEVSKGLFRFVLGHQNYVFFCARGRAARVPGQVGKYLALRRRRHVLRYNRLSRQLSLPSACRPPFLIERALVLCSGHLPRYRVEEGRGTLDYLDIPANVATATAALLCQELR